MENIGLSVDIKRRVENIECARCEGAMLIFQRIEYEEGFVFGHGGSVVVDTYCKSCDTDSAVVVQMPTS